MRPLLTLSTWLLAVAQLHGQYPDVSPPPGIPVPAADREELCSGAERLRADIATLVASGTLAGRLAARLPDVEIFPKAVSWALELDEIYDPKELGFARGLLAEGRARLDAMRRGEMPWTTATGPVVRGYRSRLDGSVQPYGVVVAADRPATGGRLDIFLHGRNDKNTELAFIHGRMHFPDLISPAQSVVLHPYGRFCNGFKFAGEVDVLEALDDAIEQYNIDPDHVGVRGMSMGGAGTYHLGAHETTRWAALGPAAGFVEAAVHGKVFAPGKVPPTAMEQRLWRLHDVPGYAVNFTNRPLIAYAGEHDPQRIAAETMAKAIEAAGGTMRHLVAPDTGHAYDRVTKAEQDRLVDEAVVRGRPRAPSRVRFATFTLRYNTLDWVEVTALDEHWEQATVDATVSGPARLDVRTTNVAGLVLRPAGHGAGTWRVAIDGAVLDCPGNAAGLAMHKADGRWHAGPAAPAGLAKRAGLQGPIDDFVMDAFAFVRPTGRGANPAVDEWVRAELERAITSWKVTFRGAPRVIDDTAVTPEVAARMNLVAWGDPRSNALIARVLPHLPLTWSAEQLVVAGQTYDAGCHVPVLIHPNPLAPRRYLVLNTSYTYRRGSAQSNAVMTPKLGDWAVLDLRTPPNRDYAGGIAAQGLFDEAWRVRAP